MHNPINNRRRALSRLMRAAQAGLSSLPAYYAEGGDPSGGGGTPEPKGDPKPTESKGPKEGERPAPKYTDDDVSERVRLALEDHDRKAREKAEREKREREAKEAEQKGEWEKLARQAERERDEHAAKARRLELKDRLRSYLDADEKRAPLAKAADVIERLIDPEAAKEDPAKAVRAAVELYEKSLPERPKSGGTPGVPPGRLPPGTRTKGAEGANGGPIRFTGAAARF